MRLFFLRGKAAFLLLLLGLLIPRPAVAQQPETETPLGFHIGRGDAEHMQAARAAGGRFVVVVFSWADIEPEPNYLYWEKPDAALRAAEYYGLELIARLDQPPAWAVDAAGPTPWRLDAYANFARRVAARYGNRLAGVILWNEPNLSLEWHGQPPDPAAYVEMLKAAYPAVKEATPDLPVAMAGLASTEGEGDWAINDLDYLRAIYAAGGGDYFDALAAHPYGFGRPPADPPEKYRPNFRRLELYRQIMAANGDADKPIWVTEMGWLTWTDDPRHDWQVVSPQTQAEYILGAIEYARQNYPGVTRLGLWELNSGGDEYGYGIWQGPEQASPAYQALAEQSDPPPPTAPVEPPVPILAADAIIRLGDRATLHPHWVHLYQGGHKFSPAWQGEFFLGQVRAYELVMETMQVDQATNRLLVNGEELAHLVARARPDVTSTWITQRFFVPPELLRPGRNSLTVEVGLRNPARQYNAGRWENFQFRHIRLVEPYQLPPPLLTGWQPRPSPGGWAETNRLRPGLAADLWLTGIRPGQLWRGAAGHLENQAANRPDLIFNDLLPTAAGELAATQRGLFWRGEDGLWQPVGGPEDSFAYVVAQANGRFYAGFEAEGLWSAPAPTGPWRRTRLAASTVVELLSLPLEQAGGPERLYATTESAIFVMDGGWRAISLPDLALEKLEEAGEEPGDKFKPRLYAAAGGGLALRYQGRLWHQPPAGQWTQIGPEHLAGKLFSLWDCCGPGMLVGTNDAGIWQLSAGGAWRRLDDSFFDTADITDLLRVEGAIYAAGDLGLFHSAEGRSWQKAAGLPPTTTDLVIDPANPSRWLAGSPAGIYRSRDGGRSWQPLTPPWTIWDMASGPQGRIFAGRTHGLVWSDNWGDSWQRADGMRDVYFLRVIPHPAEARRVWSGTWGNNIAVSEDGGLSVDPLHNGLETLTGLDLLWHPTPGQLTLATIEGLYRTDDGGQSWFKLPGPLARQTIYSLLQTDDGTIWAGAADGLWHSRDYGASWQLAEGLPRIAVLRLGRLAPSQQLWAGTEGMGLWLSRDEGQSWQWAGLPERTIYHLLREPGPDGRLLAATDRGIFATAE